MCGSLFGCSKHRVSARSAIRGCLAGRLWVYVVCRVFCPKHRGTDRWRFFGYSSTCSTTKLFFNQPPEYDRLTPFLGSPTLNYPCFVVDKMLGIGVNLFPKPACGSKSAYEHQGPADTGTLFHTTYDYTNLVYYIQVLRATAVYLLCICVLLVCCCLHIDFFFSPTKSSVS